MSSPSDSENDHAEKQGAEEGKNRMRTRTISVTTEDKDKVVRKGNKIVYTSGRPPWYNSSGQMKEAFVIGISGGSASGKTSVACKIIEALGVPWVSLISMDSFYKQLGPEQVEQATNNNYNFDEPQSFDLDLIASTLKRLKEGKSVEIPIYNFTIHQREKNKKTIYGANVVIFEGIFAFREEIIKYMDCKIFVEADSDVRLARRLKRDILERGREVKGVIKQYMRFVKPAYDTHIECTKNMADIILPRGGHNAVGISLIVNLVNQRLKERGFSFRADLKQSAANSSSLPPSIHLLPSSNQIKGLHTLIRNRTTSRDEFIFYSKRLMRILVEHAISLLPYKECIVDTVQGTQYNGVKLNTKTICGVSILRAGETMETALCAVCKHACIGKILIQTNQHTGEPELHYLRLPKSIKEHHVILMEATMATGAAAIMAIRVLLDHDVPEENILLVSLLMALPGVHSVAYAFPGVKLVTTAVDNDIDNNFHILPGIGNFGDRYFGTEPS